MGLRQVIFMSRKEAEALSGRWVWSIISISGLNPASLQSGWHSVLRLEFDDIDVDERFVPRDPYILFNPDHAEQIVKFVAQCDRDEVDTLVVHCQGGISRSAAVAKWVARAYGLEFPSDYTKENRYVYETLCRVSLR